MAAESETGVPDTTTAPPPERQSRADDRFSNQRIALATVLSVTPVHAAIRLSGYPSRRSFAAWGAIAWYRGGSKTSIKSASIGVRTRVRMLSFRVHHPLAAKHCK